MSFNFSSTSSPYTGPNYSLLGTTVAPISPSEETAVNLGLGTVPGGLSLFNPSVSGIMDTIQGKFPGLNQETGDLMSSLASTLFNIAQPELQKGTQAITSEATGVGQRGISTPGAEQIGNLYNRVINDILGQSTQAGVNQYGQDLGLSAAAQRIGLQEPNTLINALTGTGGIQRRIAQDALTSLYQQFLQQTGVSQNDINNMLQYILGGIAVPNEAPTKFGPSPFQELVDTATSILPFLGGFNSGLPDTGSLILT